MGLTRPKYSNIVDTDYKQSVRVVTTTNITLSGGAPSTYDGVTLIAGDRILVNAQSTGNQNGIYTVSVVGSGSNGTWARAFDASINERVTAGMRTFIAEGTYAGTEYRLVTPDPITLGTTSLSFQSTAATVSGTNRAVQYNNAGFIAGAASLVYDNVTGNVVAAAATTSTSPTTGALVVSGGAGVAGNINVGGNIVATGVGLSSFAGSMSVAGVATFNSNVVIVGNLTTLGNTFITNSTDLSIQDSIINLHSPSDLTPLVTNDGKDIGLKLHYYDTVDSAAFIGRDNATGYLVWEDRGTDVAGIFTGTSFGTFKTGNIILTGNTYRGSTNNLTNALLYKASSTAPTSPLVGDQWYDTSTDTLYEWFTDGVSSFWVDKLSQPVAISFASQTTAPTGGKPGDYWYDTSTDTLYTYVYDGLSYNWVDFSSKQPAPVTATSATAGTTNLSTSVSGVLGVPYGGTGSVNFTSGNLLVGAGTSAITASTLKVDPTYGNLVVATTTASADNTSGALVVKGGVGITGNINLTYNPVSAIGSAIQLTGKDTQGGTGYFDFFKATNTTSGATNPNKTIRLNSTGGIEVINSGYTATLLSLSDAGALNISSSISVGGKKAVNGPAFRAYVDSNQTIVQGAQRKVTFGTENFDTDGCFASSTFTPTVEGYYQFNAVVRISGTSGTGEVMIVLYKNGAEYARGINESGTEQGANFYSMSVSDIAYANGTTDNFEVYIQQSSGADRTTTAGSAISHFSGAMVRGA